MSEKDALEEHDYYVQKIMEDWKGFTEFVFSDFYSCFNFEHASAFMEYPVIERQYFKNLPTRGVIKGYVDIFMGNIYVTFKDKNDESEIRKEISYAIEVKSHIKSITETMRQINTHRTFLPMGTPYVVASPDNRFNDIFASQNVIYVELEKPNF